MADERDRPIPFEPRWPVVLTVVAVLAVLALLPSRTRLLPSWTPYAVGITLIVPLAGSSLSGGRPVWLRVERITTIAFSVIAEAVTLATLYYLISEMMERPQLPFQTTQ